jgi:hypothetical protein
MNHVRTLGPALLLTLATACGGGSSYEITDQPLTGTVGAAPWTFVAGSTDAFLSEGEDHFFAVFYAETYTPCGFGEPTSDHLIVSVPKQPGSYDFDLQLNMTFVTGNDNLVATDGTVRVDTVTTTAVTGGLHGVYDGDNEVDGNFQLTICAPTP